MSNSNLAGVLPLFIVLGLGVLVVCIVAWCKIFRKADIHPGKLFIPFYGQYLMYSIANCEGLFAASIVISVLSSCAAAVRLPWVPVGRALRSCWFYWPS